MASQHGYVCNGGGSRIHRRSSTGDAVEPLFSNLFTKHINSAGLLREKNCSHRCEPQMCDCGYDLTGLRGGGRLRKRQDTIGELKGLKSRGPGSAAASLFTCIAPPGMRPAFWGWGRLGKSDAVLQGSASGSPVAARPFAARRRCGDARMSGFLRVRVGVR